MATPRETEGAGIETYHMTSGLSIACKISGQIPPYTPILVYSLDADDELLILSLAMRD
jgi:hypothetical protein